MIGGTLKDEGRKLVSDIGYVQEGTIDGWAIYELAVNREGDVTSVALKETNLTRTSAKYQIHNYLSKLKFQKGAHYPQFHHVQIKITLVKPKGS